MSTSPRLLGLKIHDPVSCSQLDAKCEAQQFTIEEHRATIDSLSSSVGLAEAECSSLQGAINAREERIDELLAGQDRTEEELDQLHAIVARLSKQAQEAEKLKNDAERRYAEQVSWAPCCYVPQPLR